MLPEQPRGPNGVPAAGTAWQGHGADLGANLGAARGHAGGLLPAGDPAALAAALGSHAGTPWTAAPLPPMGAWGAGWPGAGALPPRGLQERPRRVVGADDAPRTRRGRPVAASASRGRGADRQGRLARGGGARARRRRRGVVRRGRGHEWSTRRGTGRLRCPRHARPAARNGAGVASLAGRRLPAGDGALGGKNLGPVGDLSVVVVFRFYVQLGIDI